MATLRASALVCLIAAACRGASGVAPAAPPALPLADARGRLSPKVHEGALPESWSAGERAAATAMLGRWRDARNQSYFVDRVNGTIGFFDLAYVDGMSARLSPSSVSFFAGAVDGRRMRFSLRDSAYTTGAELIVERQEGEDCKMQWVSSPIRKSEHTSNGPRYRKWNPGFSDKDVALAERLLGTWKAPASNALSSWLPFRSDSETRLITFDVGHHGHLRVRLGSSSPVALQPTGVVFEGSFGDIWYRILTRFTLAEDGRRLFGEWEKVGIGDPAWRVAFQLFRVPDGEPSVGPDALLPQDFPIGPSTDDEGEFDSDEERFEGAGEVEPEWWESVRPSKTDGSCSHARMALAAIMGLAIGVAAWGLAISWWRRSSRVFSLGRSRNGRAGSVELGGREAPEPGAAAASSGAREIAWL